MRRHVLSVLLSILPAAQLVAEPVRYHVPDGDVIYLERALCAAKQDEQALIELAPSGNYGIINDYYLRETVGFNGDFFCPGEGGRLLGFPPAREIVGGDITISGNGATLLFGPTYGFTVSSGARLRLLDLTVTRGSTTLRHEQPFLRNEGTVELERVEISSWITAPPLSAVIDDDLSIAGAIHNRGRLAATNVEIAFSRATLSPPPANVTTPACIRTAGAILNEGQLTLRNATIRENGGGLTSNTECVGTAHIYTAPEATTTLSTSLVGNANPSMRQDECQGPIQSDGTSVGRGGCIDEAAGDRDFRSENLSRRVVTDCPRRDRRGLLRPTELGCHVGASDSESSPPFAPEFANGLWYDRDNDGHYLSIQYVRPRDVLVMWQTFDSIGNQVWVYGVGQPDEDTPPG